jgi:PAS domain S-box-containing protein
LQEYIHPDDQPQVTTAINEAIRKKSIFEMEHRIRRKDGSLGWTFSRAVPLKDANGEIVEWFGAASDITERKRAEEKLQEERDFNTAILDTAGALVIVLDKEGRIMRFNRACEDITGYSTPEVLGRVFVDFLVPPEELQGVQQTWNALCAGDFPNQHENHWVAKDGSRRLIAWSNTAITSGKGKIDYIIGTGVDITERKRAEQAMHEAHERSKWRRDYPRKTRTPYCERP